MARTRALLQLSCVVFPLHMNSTSSLLDASIEGPSEPNIATLVGEELRCACSGLPVAVGKAARELEETHQEAHVLPRARL